MEVESDIFSQLKEGVVLKIHVQPGAKKTECTGLYGRALKFRIAAPPVDGLANEALCGYLSKVFKIPKGDAVISSGRSVRQKRVLLKGVTIKRVKEKFLNLISDM